MNTSYLVCAAALFCAPAFAQPTFAQLAVVPVAPPQPAQQVSPLTSVIPSYIVVPLVPIDGFGGPAIKVRLNNKTDAYFLIDTGSYSSSVTRDVAVKMGVKLISFKPKLEDGVGLNRYDYVEADSIQFDRVNFHGELIVRDIGFGKINGEAVGGFIGTNFLSGFAVLLDFDRNQLLLVPNGKLTEVQLDALGFGKTTQIPNAVLLPADKSVTVSLQIALDETLQPSRFQVATGSSDTILANGYKTKEAPLITRSIQREKGSVNFKVYQVGSAAVGNAAVAPFTLGVMPASPANSSFLGMDFLSHFRVLIDYPAQRLYLAPVTSKAMFPTIASQRNAAQSVWGVVYEPMQNGVWQIKSVSDAGLSTANLYVGDTLTEVNGHKTDGLLPQAFAAAFSKDANRLRLLRDGKAIEVFVKKPAER